jgi:ribosome biogenesis GTPase
VSALESLGWNPSWAGRFEPHVAAGCFPGRVCVEHKGLYQFYGEGGEGTAQVSGRFRHEARGRADFPAVGDWVALRQGPGDSLAVIHAVLPRDNQLSRKLPGKAIDEQVVAANLDTLFLLTSLNRDLNPRRIERYLAAASAAQLRPVLVLNKSDLSDRPQEAVELLRAAIPGVPVHAVSARTGEGLADLAPYLGCGQTVALVGSSGVGKSTLLNRLLGAERQPVQAIRVTDDRGRHTTTQREMLFLPQGGLVIDNPGMRELQLWDEDTDLDGPFADIAALAARCHYPDCRHQHEPRCAVQQALAEGVLEAGRFANYCKMQRELAYLESQRDAHAERRRKERDKKIHRAFNKDQRRRGRR